MPAPPGQTVLEYIVHKLEVLTADLDIGQISASTRIKDLGLRSIVVVNALAEIQDHFRLEDQLLTRLLATDIQLDEQTVADVAGYVAAASESLDS